MRELIIGTAVGLIAAAALSAQQPAGTTGSTDASQRRARATLQDARGRTVGEAILQQATNGVLVRLELRDMPPGRHALHVHETGRCDAPAFESAGGHFSPDSRQHGFFNARGPHAGDVPNIDVPESGRAVFEHLIAGVTLASGSRSLLDADGSAIVIHDREDDYETDPAGNAGDRIACGVIR